MSGVSPWLMIAGLGAFHGLNPAMGWLFAVALGLHRGSRGVVWLSLLPIALGHALSVAAVLAVVLSMGLVVEGRLLEIVAGVALLGWAGWHAAFGHRRRVRVGMTTGMAGLGLWSFLMATAHGAGLMLVPVVLPLCLAASPAGELTAGGSAGIALAAVGVHMAAMLVVTGAVATAVCQVFGLDFLRRGWINLDLVWTGALVACGIWLIL